MDAKHFTSCPTGLRPHRADGSRLVLPTWVNPFVPGLWKGGQIPGKGKPGDGVGRGERGAPRGSS